MDLTCSSPIYILSYSRGNEMIYRKYLLIIKIRIFWMIRLKYKKYINVRISFQISNKEAHFYGSRLRKLIIAFDKENIISKLIKVRCN